jgi:hypothetical protein
MNGLKFCCAVLIISFLSESCSRSFIDSLPDADPLIISICKSCNTIEDIIDYENSLGSEMIDLTGRMKYEWRIRRVSVTTGDDKPDLNQYATFAEDSLMFFFRRSNSSLEGFNEATSYFFTNKKFKTDGALFYFFFPGEDIFGYHKSGSYQDTKKVIHRWVREVSPEQFFTNYHSILLWIQGLEDERFKLVRERCRIEGLEYWSKRAWKENHKFKFEVEQIEELLFHEYVLYDTYSEWMAVSVEVVTYAPTETYAVYEEGNPYPLHYKIDLSDLAFLITISSDFIADLDLNKH